MSDSLNDYPCWDYPENMGLPSNMQFSPGSEFEVFKAKLHLSKRLTLGVFGVTGVWFLILQDDGCEVWTKQCDTKDNALERAAIEAVKLTDSKHLQRGEISDVVADEVKARIHGMLGSRGMFDSDASMTVGIYGVIEPYLRANMPVSVSLAKCKWELSKVFVPNGIWNIEEGMKMERAAKAVLDAAGVPYVSL